MKQELVRNWMTYDVIAIPPDTPLPEVHRLMTKNWIRRLPVIDKGKLVGIITLGDVREAEASDVTTLSIWELNYILSKLQAWRVMTCNPLTISPEATIGEAAKIMMEKKISGLPVIDEKKQVIGIITESDIFRMVVEAWTTITALP